MTKLLLTTAALSLLTACASTPPDNTVALLTAVNLHTQATIPISVSDGFWTHHGNCEARAQATRAELARDGIPSVIWTVITSYPSRDNAGIERFDELHAVVEAQGYILDSNLSYVETRKELERDGYKFLEVWNGEVK